jgi:hypothetical protein
MLQQVLRPRFAMPSARLPAQVDRVAGANRRCRGQRASIRLDAIRRPRNTPIWKLEAALKCRSCRTLRYSPPVHMIRLTEIRETAPYIICGFIRTMTDEARFIWTLEEQCKRARRVGICNPRIAPATS